MLAILKDVGTYAFRGSGKYILLAASLISICLNIILLVPMLGFLVALLLLGYMSTIYFEVIQTTATGRSEVPDFPEMTNFLRDVLWPMLQVVMVLTVSLSPWIIYEAFIDGEKGVSMIGNFLLALGAIYFPMAMMAVVVLGYLGAMNPVIVIPAIFNAGWLYWLSPTLLALLYWMEYLISDVFEGVLIVGSVVLALVGMVALMTNGRILGMIYREKKEDLGWL